MKKQLLACFSVIALFFITQLSFADTNTNLLGKYSGMQFGAATGKNISLPRHFGYATEILVINNTPDTVKVEVPYTNVSDWLEGNRVYRIISSILFPTTNVRIWHPSFGYMDNYVSHYSIVSFSIQYRVAHLITIEYH